MLIQLKYTPMPTPDIFASLDDALRKPIERQEASIFDDSWAIPEYVDPKLSFAAERALQEIIASVNHESHLEDVTLDIENIVPSRMQEAFMRIAFLRESSSTRKSLLCSEP